jgi:hypothetical protein
MTIIKSQSSFISNVFCTNKPKIEKLKAIYKLLLNLNLIANETITYLVEDGHFTISKKMKALLIAN